MGNRALKKRIASLLAKIAEHEEKVRNELTSGNPDIGLIRHWQTEITAFINSLERARKRLG